MVDRAYRRAVAMIIIRRMTVLLDTIYEQKPLVLK